MLVAVNGEITALVFNTLMAFLVFKFSSVCATLGSQPSYGLLCCQSFPSFLQFFLPFICLRPLIGLCQLNSCAQL